MSALSYRNILFLKDSKTVEKFAIPHFSRIQYKYMKKLYKSDDSRVASGVFGGLGEWMEVSPGILRVGYVVLIVLTGIIPGLLLYAIAHFLVPKKRFE